jgi:NAD(P)-dependent dehydrogenase (short-subunit alcohol dehydrogenase family)
MTADVPSGAFPTLPMPKAALVTGAGQRIGRACALALADAGFAVAVHYLHSSAPAEGVAREIRDRGGKAIPLAADLTDESETKTLLARRGCARADRGAGEQRIRV